MGTRKPIVGGQFYPSDKDMLLKQLKDCFLGNLGPKNLPKKHLIKTDIKAVISPHAGYAYSGMCAAHSFIEISRSSRPDLFIMLGLSHQGYPSCISIDDWETPLGIIKNDRGFGKFLHDNTSLKINEIAHQEEHSIEVMLPFLQFIYYDDKPALERLRICPIIVSHDKDFIEFGKKIKELISQSKKKVIFIASSDFTHYGFNYNYFPFSENVKENMYNLDKKAIDLILKGESGSFLRYIDDTGATICGKYPIAALLNSIDLKKASLLKYYTSGDISGDYTSAVGYASIAFR